MRVLVISACLLATAAAPLPKVTPTEVVAPRPPARGGRFRPTICSS